MATWHVNDLTAATGAPAAAPSFSRGPAGYVFDAQGTQHVVYIGVDSHVHELWWNTSGWHHLASRRPTGEIGQGASAPTTTVDLASLLQQRATTIKACRFFGHSAMKSITPMF